MKSPKSEPKLPSQASDLLGQLEKTTDSSLEDGVITAEGANGSLIEPKYSRREMKCYSITESELQQLSLVNSLVAFAWSVLSGIGLFVLDVAKDFIMAEKVPEKAVSFVWYTWPLLAFLVIVAALGVLKAVRWRKNLMTLIKEESKL